MGLPNINITFKEEGTTAVQRGERGIVALIFRDDARESHFEVQTTTDIPEDLSDFNKDQIKMALRGYVTPPRKVIGYVIDEEAEDYNEALDYLETVRFDYLVIPEVTSGEADEIASWIKSLRDTKEKKSKAVLPNIDADHEGVVNFTTDNIETEDDSYTTAEFCSRIAGLIAGTPLTIASTFAPVPEVIDCDRLTRDQLDEAIENGEFVIFNDGEKIKVARGVNSLTTTGEGKQEGFTKIKIVEAMDLIHDDIKRLAEDNYLGKYANSYDNKLLLLVAIQGYLEGLELDGVLESGLSDVYIDVDKQASYLKETGVDTEDMNEQDIKSANTKDKVFLGASIKILDAIEEIDLDITI